MLQQNKPQMFSTAFYLVKGQTRAAGWQPAQKHLKTGKYGAG
jgi:hypothetical protein